MKKIQIIRLSAVFILTFSLTFLSACSDDNDDIDDVADDTTAQTLSDGDKASLLFMLEEEKLARDTYAYLNDVWSVNQFANIKNSEQTHMDAIENQLIINNIDYSILPAGEFSNQDLQNLYDQFVIDGAVSKSNAFQIGATIEDLDIVDLQDYLNGTTDTTIISVFESLQCGSRNHLRNFMNGIQNLGETYTPQFLTQEEFNSILSGSQEQCN